jgi:hypothetical protein
MKIKAFSLFSFMLTAILLTLILEGCGKSLEPVSANSIALYNGGDTISQASAFEKGLPMTVWGFQGSELTSGPFKGWEIYTEDGSFTGLKEYMISSDSASSIKDFYDNELSDEWSEGKDINEDGYSGFSWKRGNQAFVAVIVEANSTYVLITYLLNK